MTYRRTFSFWVTVRNNLALQAQAWSRGSEGQALFENLCEHEEWLSRCEELAPRNRKLGPQACAAIILANFFPKPYERRR
jgi:hypothetical protein